MSGTQDPVEAAVDKVDGEPAAEDARLTEQITVRIGLPGDRAGMLVLPADVSALEWLAIVTYITGTVAPHAIAAHKAEMEAAAPPSGLVIPRPRLVTAH